MKTDARPRPFGEIALQKKYITLEQLLRALNVQRHGDIEKGERKLIGAILHEQGALDYDQYNEILNYSRFMRANADI